MNVRSILFILPILLTGPLTVGAQPTMPSSATPDKCLVEPLSPERLTEIVAAGFEPAGDHKETDAPVDPLVQRAIANVVIESLACTNANQPLRSLALYTDRYLAERFSGEKGNDELGHLLAASTRTPQPATEEDYLTLVGIEHTVIFEDGRLGTTVWSKNAIGTYIDLLIFVETEDGWLIDQVLLGDEFIPAATPVTT